MADGPSYAEVSRRICSLLVERGEEWAGIPMPIPGFSLRVEASSPWLDRIGELEAIVNGDAPTHREARAQRRQNGDGPMVTLRNCWFSTRLRRTVGIGELEGQPGKFVPVNLDTHDYARRFTMAFDTMAAGAAWTLETEFTAVERLRGLLKGHLWEAYLLTGQFIETSRRSGVTYVFRRCRPTIAYRAGAGILACLCLHPIAYYEGTHAGGMCPTDDVIAHLMLMRGDEHLYWRRANQHQPERPEAGL